MRTERFEKVIHDTCRVELLCRNFPHNAPIQNLCLFDRVDEDIEGQRVCIALDARCTRWQPLDDDARFAMSDKRGSGSHPNSRASGQQDLLKSQRFRDLQEEFRKARENDDLAKIEALELEMDQLTNAVTEATGLGGRSRQKTDIEKIRKSVREAISRDMRRIGKKHELLGNHLTTFVDTGLTCRYIPEPMVEWVT